ncbi:MAG: TetR family transcriptional regulator [Alphaproteobacteria bacterium]
MGKKPASRPTRKGNEADRIIEAALGLAATQGWRDTTLADIAAAAKLPLAEVHRNFASKAAILAAFSRRIDETVLAGEDPELAGQSPRDRLFDVIMRRFDALAPHKAAVGALVRDGCTDPLIALCGARSLRRSMAWMLEAARIDSSGLRGLVRTKGLAAIYLAVLRVWLDDDSADMARTMAALDRRLTQAERLMAFCRLPRPRRRRTETETA